jgi:hypothetical protein
LICPAAALADSAGAPSRRADEEEIERLVQQVRPGDAAICARIFEQLRQRGLSEQELGPIRSLAETDVAERLRFARCAIRVAPRVRTAWLLALLGDSDCNVRSAAIEALRALPPSPVLRGRIERIERGDPDELVRRHARLLLAEWALNADEVPGHVSLESPANRAPAASSDSGRRDPSALRAVEPDFASSPSDPSSPMRSPLTLTDPAHSLRSEGTSLGVKTGARDAPGAIGGNGTPVSFQSEGPALPLLPVTNGDRPRGTPNPNPDTPRKGLLPPDVLNRPIEPPFTQAVPPLTFDGGALLGTSVDAPLGFTGPSSVLPTEAQESSDFVPIEDRWRIGFPEWDRYGKGHPCVDDYPYVEGHWWDPFNQNVLKGDYPIIGQHTFLAVTASTDATFEFRDLPAPTSPFESIENPTQRDFLGNPRQFFYTQYFALQTNLFHGNADFKPVDWQIQLTPVFNLNDLNVNELGIVSPNVQGGTNRFRDDLALQEYFVEAKLADIGPNYDFVSVRAGSQPFTSDFRGFIFSDTNRAIRLFGTDSSNRDQFNVIWFDQQEKDTDSQLNTFENRDQQVFIMNYYRQDFIFPGYTAEVSFHWDHDEPSTKLDDNGFQVRPDPVGDALPHEVDAYYFGIAGDGHIGILNITDAFYWVVGRDSMNPLAGAPQEIDAKMAAIELSYDRDWVRFRGSYFYASGDDNLYDNKARGFDTILDDPNFAGGQFSYWDRQAIPLFGLNLTQRLSLVPDLRSSKVDGQANFVNPGLQLYNVGMDFEVTPKLKLVTNANFLWFDTTEVLEQLLKQSVVHSHIGTDLSLGIEYRPLLNDNIVVISGLAMLIPGQGFDDIYGANPSAKGGNTVVDLGPQYSNFLQVVMRY